FNMLLLQYDDSQLTKICNALCPDKIVKPHTPSAEQNASVSSAKLPNIPSPSRGGLGGGWGGLEQSHPPPSLPLEGGGTSSEISQDDSGQRADFWWANLLDSLKEISPPSVKNSAAKPRYPTQPKEEGEYFVNNSGLILLVPFLPRFFVDLYSSDKKLLSDPVLAVGLLHYLAYGQLPTSEQELALNKLLCGLPLTAALDLPNAFSDAQREEAVALLNAVILHWAALKAVSVTWLQQVFIQRPGILRRSNGQWLLRVESRPPDVLLSKLPWGISTVKLPWVESILTIDWQY
ncbi:MAG: contractile injection system tape measure protein, partial [Gallionellaceae bacterium]